MLGRMWKRLGIVLDWGFAEFTVHFFEGFMWCFPCNNENKNFLLIKIFLGNLFPFLAYFANKKIGFIISLNIGRFQKFNGK